MDEQQIQKISKALADPHRRAILQMIAKSSSESVIHCSVIVDRLPVSQPTVSHHIKELAAADLIEIHPDGLYNRLSVKQDVLDSYLEALKTAFAIPDLK